ncbi:hypothetical protein GN956_G9201 [Arapaima gigas]
MSLETVWAYTALSGSSPKIREAAAEKAAVEESRKTAQTKGAEGQTTGAASSGKYTLVCTAPVPPKGGEIRCPWYWSSTTEHQSTTCPVLQGSRTSSLGLQRQRQGARRGAM